MHYAGIALVITVSALAWSLPGLAAPLSATLCSAQPLINDAALTGMFDAGYSITCRDAALPVGMIYQLRSGGDPQARTAALRRKEVTCHAPSEGSIEGLGAVRVIDFRLAAIDVGYRVYEHRRGGQFYSPEGLAGYDSALRLGLERRRGQAGRRRGLDCHDRGG